MSALGEHALGMELHTLDGQRAMTQTHDDGGARIPSSVGFWSACCYLEFGWQFVLGNDERMIARTREGRGQSGKNSVAIMINLARFAVHELMGANNLAAKGLAD